MGCPLRSIGLLLEDYSCPQALGNFVTAPPTAERQQQDVVGIGGLFTKGSEIQCSQALSNFATASARLDTNIMMSVASVAAAASAAPGGGAYPGRPRSPPPRLGSPGLVQVPLFAPARTRLLGNVSNPSPPCLGSLGPVQLRSVHCSLLCTSDCPHTLQQISAPAAAPRQPCPRVCAATLQLRIELEQLCLNCTHFVCHSQVAGCVLHCA